MPLSQDQEDLEHELRVETMSIGLEQARTNIEQLRFDIAQRQREADERAAERQRAAEERQRAAEERAAEWQRAAEARAAERQKELAWELRKFVVQTVLALAAALGAGVALANYVNSRPAAPPVPQAAAPAATPSPAR